MFPRPTPKRKYCRKHGIEYDGYLCPECREEMGRRESNGLSKKAEKIKSDKKFQELLDGIFNAKRRETVKDETRPHTVPKPSSPKESAEPEVTTPLRAGVEKKDVSEGGSVVSDFKTLSWVIALLFVFGLSICGLGISLFVGSFVPLWLLFGFFLVFSVEKWFSRQTIRYKAVGKLYKLLLNLTVLAVLGLIIWTGVILFSKQFVQSALVGSLIFLGEFVFLIWLRKVVVKNSWRWPSMKLTVVCLVALFCVLAFAGCQPMATYKDSVVEKCTSWLVGGKEVVAEVQQGIEKEVEEARTRLEVVEQERLEEQRAMEATRKDVEVAKVVSDVPVAPTIVDEVVTQVEGLYSTDTSDYADKYNAYRQSKGLQPLLFTDDLNRLARLRLEELRRNFSHTSAGGYNSHLAENIGMSTGSLSNSGALSMWKGSPGHNANMLDRDYRYTGYACGGGYAVQLFTEYPTVNGEPQLPPGWYWDD